MHLNRVELATGKDQGESQLSFRTPQKQQVPDWPVLSLVSRQFVNHPRWRQPKKAGFADSEPSVCRVSRRSRPMLLPVRAEAK